MKSRIRTFHGQLVIVDVELAAIVGIAPKQLHDLLMRRRPKIPLEFVFPLPMDELGNLEPPISGIRLNSRGAHLVLTEHGVILVAAVLHDPRAVELAIQVARDFASLRDVHSSNADLTLRVESLGRAIATLDRETQRHFKVINEALGSLEESPPRGIRPQRNLH